MTFLKRTSCCRRHHLSTDHDHGDSANLPTRSSRLCWRSQSSRFFSMDDRIARSLHLADQKPELSISQLAREANLSVSAFHHLAKRELGMGFKKYIAEERLQLIYSRIVSGSDLIKTIQYDSGFLDAPTFSRWIKRRFGKSPANLRNRTGL